MSPTTRAGFLRHSRPSDRVLGLVMLGAVVGLLLVGGNLGSASALRTTPTGPAPSTTHPHLAGGPGVPVEGRARGTGPTASPTGATLPQWINVTPTGTAPNPSASASAVMAYDPIDHETIYFGGCAQAQCPGNETWAYSNGTWVNLTDWQASPPARYGAVMDYDPNMQGVLLFGGHSAGLTYLNDTWLFQDGAWTNLTRISPTAPAPREYSSMAFDPEPEENGSVLFGGHVYNLGDANDTWIWEGWSGWVFLNTSASPPTSEMASMAYDPLLGAIVLFGCGDSCTTGSNWTWELYSGQWWRVVASPPSGGYRVGSAMTWDPALSVVLLFGGYGFSGYLGDTWTFSGSSWEQLPALSTDPSGRYLAALSTDSSSFPPLLFGGSQFYPFGASPLNDTWVFEIPPSVSLASPASAEVSAPIDFTLTVVNGTAPYTALFNFGDGTHALYSMAGPSMTVSHTFLRSGVYYPMVNVTDAAGVLRFGGAAAGTGVNVSAGPSLAPLPPIPVSDVNLTIQFAGSNVLGGHAPFGFAWEFGDGSNASGQNVNHAYSAPGTYSGTYSVTDASGASSTVEFSATVNSQPTLVVASTPSSPSAGTPTAFYGNVSGGTAPFAYSWSFGDGATSSLPFPSHNYSASGTYTVEVTVNDSVGASTHRTLVLTVQAGHPSTPKAAIASGVPVWFWPGIGGLVVVGAVGSYVLWRRAETNAGR